MKKQKIFTKKITKQIHNNQKECLVDEKKEVKRKDSNLSIDEKIKELFDGNGYPFSKNVKIITSNKEYTTFIVGMVNNRLITIDNDVIDLGDIKDLIIM